MSNQTPTALEKFFQILVEDSAGNRLPQRPVIQFTGGSAPTDDPANNRTVVPVGSGSSLPEGAEGDLMVFHGGVWTALAPGAPGSVVTSRGTSSEPVYRALPSANRTISAGDTLHASVNASSGGTSGVLSADASLTLSGTSLLVLCDWVGVVTPGLYRAIPYLEYSCNGGAFTEFATGRCPGIPGDGVYTASGIDTSIHFNRVLSGLPAGASVVVHLGVACYGASGSFNCGVGDGGSANVLTLIDLG